MVEGSGKHQGGSCAEHVVISTCVMDPEKKETWNGVLMGIRLGGGRVKMTLWIYNGYTHSSLETATENSIKNIYIQKADY